MKVNILLVDNKPLILKSLQRLLIMATDHEIYAAKSGVEALKILEKNKIDVIVSDMRMPYMSDYQLLKQVRYN